LSSTIEDLLQFQERRYNTMRTLLVSICALILAFMFVSCKTTPKATSETSKPEKPLATGSFNLNGKWKVSGQWKNEYRSGTFNFQYEIVQKGMEITMINTRSGSKFLGTLKGNIIHMEPRITEDPKGATIFFPAREVKVSQDGNTLTSEFDYTWRGESDGRERLNPGSMRVTYIRE
jgi:hypothetical protein